MVVVVVVMNYLLLVAEVVVEITAVMFVEYYLYLLLR